MTQFYKDLYDQIFEYKRIMVQIYRNRWGNVIEVPETNIQDLIVQSTLDNFYEHQYKKASVEGWIQQYHIVKAQERLDKEAAEVAMSKTLLDVGKIDRDSAKKSNRGSQPSPPKTEPVLIKKDSIVLNLAGPTLNLQGPKIIVFKFEQPKINQLSTGTTGPDTPTRKIKKSIFHPYVTSRKTSREGHPVSLEDFKEFEKIPVMVKMDPRENPQISDMNRVLADKLKKRYNSTYRF